MTARIRRHLSYANVVATLALFLALGGGAIAAVKLKANQVKGKNVASGAIATRHFGAGATAPNATSAANANALGGSGAGAFQQKCQVGAIFGHASVDLVALAGSTSYVEQTTQPRFNCSGGLVKVRQIGFTPPFQYFVWFEGNPAGLAVVTPRTSDSVGVFATTDPTIGNARVFQVETSEPSGFQILVY